MKKTLLSFLFAGLTFTLNAQSNFRPGYIIDNEADTLQGLIDFRTDIHNSRICRFKTAETAPVTDYNPGEIESFRFTDDGKYYVSKVIKIGDESRLVFLEYLIQGMMNLYYYIDPDQEQKYYFFENEAKEMVPVTKGDAQIRRMENQGDQLFSVQDTKYKGVVGYVFRDQPSLIKNPDAIEFNQKTMIELVKQYHDLTCTTGEECVEFAYDYNRRFAILKFSAYAGVQFNNYDLFYYASQITGNSIVQSSSKTTSPMIGAQLDISSQRRMKSFSIQLDLSLAKFSGDQEYNPSPYVYKRFDFDALMLRGAVGPKYTYHKGKVRPTVEAGFAYMRNIARSSTFLVENSSDTPQNTTFDDLVVPATNLFGFYAGAGVDFTVGEKHAVFCRIIYEGCWQLDFNKTKRLSTGGRDNSKTVMIKAGYTF